MNVIGSGHGTVAFLLILGPTKGGDSLPSWTLAPEGRLRAQRKRVVSACGHVSDHRGYDCTPRPEQTPTGNTHESKRNILSIFLLK